MICCVCEPEEELTIDPTIHLDVSRVVLPPADDGRVAETHQFTESAFSLDVLSLLITLITYAAGTREVLWTNRGPRFPTPWSQNPYVCTSNFIEYIDTVHVFFYFIDDNNYFYVYIHVGSADQSGGDGRCKHV